MATKWLEMVGPQIEVLGLRNRVEEALEKGLVFFERTGTICCVGGAQLDFDPRVIGSS